MRRRVATGVLTIVMLAALAPCAAGAPTESAPISVAEILPRADTDERLAKGVVQRDAAPDPTVRLSPRLEVIARSVDGKLLALKPDDLLRLPVMRLESLERHWKFDASRFERWDKEFQQAVTAYATEAAELSRRRGEWEATQRIVGVDNIPAALVARMDSVIGELEEAEQFLSEPLARQVELSRRASAIDERIGSGERAVVRAIDDIDSRLLRLDAPPLWDVRASEEATSAFASLAPGLQIEARFARDYAGADNPNARALRVLQVLLLPFLLWLGFRNRAAPPEESRAPSTRVLRRPFSSWLLLSMVGVLVFEPAAPLMVHHAAMLLALVPVLRLLPPESDRLLTLWPYVATTLYLLAGLGYLFASNAFLYRIFLLALTVLALALFLWGLWSGRRPAAEALARRFGKALRLSAWIGVALLCVSAVANLFGNVSLAEMLTGGVIDSGYFALLMYAGVNVLTSLLRLLLARPGLTRIAREHATPLVSLLIRLLTLVGVVGWLIFMLQSFRILRPTYAFLTSILSREFTFGEISISLGHVLLFAVSVLVAFWTARVVRLVLRDEVLARMPLPRGVANSVETLTYYALLLLGWVLALSAAGFKSSQLVLIFGALGVGIGFGLQNVVNNFVSGLILMFERPIQPGDIVDVSGTSGRVRDIGIRATTIRTFEGADVIVPNGALLSSNLTNWTLTDRSRRFEVSVGVAYGTAPARVIELLRAAAHETPGIALQPAPVALFTGFGASSLDFLVRAWTPDFDSWVDIRSDLATRIHAALEKAQIEVPFPQRDLHLRSVSQEAAAALQPARGLDTSPAAGG